jgi:hypothetical protein
LTTPSDAAAVSENPKGPPSRNPWKLASIALGIVAGLLLVLILVLIIRAPGGDGTVKETPSPSVSTLRSACVTFDAVAGKTFGRPATPDTEAFTENGIGVGIHAFETTFGETFGSIEIVEENPALNFGSDNYAALNQITLEFDFAALPFDVREVKFHYWEHPSSTGANLGVNRGDVYKDGALTEANDVINGVSWSVSDTAGASEGTLSGAIEELRIGGGGLEQSVQAPTLFVDTVCAKA